MKLKHYQDYCKCGNIKSKNAKRCRECHSKGNRRQLSRSDSFRGDSEVTNFTHLKEKKE